MIKCCVKHHPLIFMPIDFFNSLAAVWCCSNDSWSPLQSHCSSKSECRFDDNQHMQFLWDLHRACRVSWPFVLSTRDLMFPRDFWVVAPLDTTSATMAPSLKIWASITEPSVPRERICTFWCLEDCEPLAPPVLALTPRSPRSPRWSLGNASKQHE